MRLEHNRLVLAIGSSETVQRGTTRREGSSRQEKGRIDGPGSEAGSRLCRIELDDVGETGCLSQAKAVMYYQLIP